MRVLSLFDGISVGCLALSRAGIKVDAYYASEIDKYAEKMSESNWSGIKRLGDVQNWPLWDGFMGVDGIDLIMAGSPCQGFSFAGKQLAFNDPRSRLFFEFVDCIKFFKPKYVLLENVRMKQRFQDIITRTMQEALDTYGGGTIYKTQINSALVSAQNRDRFYWTNWPVSQPKDRGILLRDILISAGNLSGLGVDVSKIQPKECRMKGGVVGLYDGKDAQATRVRDANGKAQTLTGGGGGLGTKMGMYDLSTLEVDASKYQHLLDGEVDPSKANVMGNIYPGKGQNGNVYSVDGKSKTLSAGTGIKGRGIGSSNSPKILLIDDYNQRLKDGDKSNTLTPNSGASAFRNGQKIVEWRPTEEEQEVIEREIMERSGDRCKGVQFSDDGIRPFNGNKSGTMSEYGKIKYPDQKSVTVTAAHAPKIVECCGPRIRKLHPVECERLQTLPDNYTLVVNKKGKQVVSDTQRYKALGNGWTCEVIAHVLRHIARKYPRISFPKRPYLTESDEDAKKRYVRECQEGCQG